MGEFSKKITTKNADGGLSETFTNSAEQGVISQLDYFDHDITNDANISGYYVVQPDNFVYNPRISVTAPCGPINRNRLNRAGVMSPLYTVFSVDESVDKTYLEHYFKTSRWHDFMFLEGNSGARSDRFSISDATFFEMPIWCPKIPEQRAIAKQLETMDSLITLHQCTYPIFYFCSHGSRANFTYTPQGQLRVLRYPRPIPKMLVSPSSPVSGVFDTTEGTRGCGSSSAIASTGSPSARKNLITITILCCRDSLSSP